MDEKKPLSTTIYHQVKTSLGVSVLDYCMADLIYKLSTNPNGDVPGWCYAYKKILASMLSITEQTVHNSINKLLEKKLVEKHPETKYLRTTQKWYDAVVIVSTKKTLVGLKSFESTTKKILVPIIRNNNNKKYNKEMSQEIKKEKRKLLWTDVKEFAKDTRFSDLNVEEQFDHFKSYCQAHGKKYVNYKSAFRNWLHNAKEFKEEKQGPKGIFARLLEKKGL